MPPPTLSHTAYINCRPAEAWRAIVDGDLTEQYFYGTKVETTWEPGAAIRYLGADGGVVADGSVIAIDPPQRLEMDFHPRWDPEMEAEGPVREVGAVEAADELRELVGSVPERIEAIGIPVLTQQVDIANARIVFATGCIANLTASRVSVTPMRKIRFFQRDGYFSIDFLSQSVSIFRRHESEGGEAPRIEM